MKAEAQNKSVLWFFDTVSLGEILLIFPSPAVGTLMKGREEWKMNENAPKWGFEP